MKKIFTLLPIVWLILGAVAIATEIKTTSPILPGQQLSGVLVTCVQSALEKRENTIISWLTTYQIASLSALQIRKSALLVAWKKPIKSEVKSAVSIAWKIYKSSLKTNKSLFETNKKLAWTTYKTEVKACKATSLVQSLDSSSLGSE